MGYAIKEIFYTLQGEGINVGRPAVFCRFSGCNLWSGREVDRRKALCRFCDTDFFGTDGINGGKFPDATNLAIQIEKIWLGGRDNRFVILTGGEPLLQVDELLINALHALGFEIAIETNGTLPIPTGIDWICVSPKVDSNLIVLQGDELKVVVPQVAQPMKWYETLKFKYFLVQPMYAKSWYENERIALEWCKINPRWRLSIQTHKYIKIP